MTSNTMTADPDALTVHVVVGWDDESEGHYVYECADGEGEPERGAFEADVPGELWSRYETTLAAWKAAVEEMVAIAGVDHDRLIQPCASWIGDRHETREWWTVAIPASGDPNIYPASGRPASIVGFPTEQQALEMIASLPERFAVLPSGMGIHLNIDRSTLIITHSPNRSYLSNCRRCNHEYAAHTFTGRRVRPAGTVEE